MARHPQDLDLDPVEMDRGPTNPGLLRIAWNHKSLLLLGVAVGLSLGALNYLRKQPIYQSSAQILIINKRPIITVSGMELQTGGATEDFAAAHLSVIKSRPVVDRTIHSLSKLGDLSRFQTFAGMDPVLALTEGLGVARDNRDVRNNSNAVINLTFNGPAAEECPTLLQSIIDSYKEFLEATYKDDTASTLKQIREIKDQVERELEESQKKWKHFRDTAPIIPRTKDGMTFQQETLHAIQQKRIELQALILQKKTQLEEIEQAITAGRDPAPLLELSTDPVKTPQVDTAAQVRAAKEAQLVPLLLKQRELMQYAGEDNGEVKNLQSRIKLLEQYFDQRSTPELLLENKVDEATVKSRIAKLRHELVHAEQLEASLKNRLDQELNDYKQVAVYMEQEEEYRRDIARTKDRLDNVFKSLPAIGLSKDNPVGGYRPEVLIPPTAALKVEPKAVSTMGVALFLGLVLGLGLAWLAEISDKSFRTPEEIRHRLGLPIVGHIPYLKADEQAAEKARIEGINLDPLLYTYYHSKSVQAEAYRGVRTALYFNTQGQGHQVIQVTSPNKGDGKSTMAANLAVSIAQSGKRVLVVDADFRRPRQHQIFGVAGRVGLATVMEGEAELSAVIQPTAVSNLDVLPCGSRPANPAELLTLPRFEELLNELRGRYDFVIVDTPPLLAVSDPSVVAPRVDGVLLTIRVSKNGRPQAERAKEILAGLGANILGVVVNAVGRLRDGYENGQYTYGYGYGYSYTYTYEPEDSKSYYDDPESSVELSGVGRNGNHSAAAATGNSPTGSNSEIDLGALPGHSSSSQSPSRRRPRAASSTSSGASRRSPRPGMMNWLRRLWS